MALDEGDYAFLIKNREDGSSIDQVLLTQDKDYRPTGIELPDVKDRTVGTPPATTLPAAPVTTTTIAPEPKQ